MAPQVKELAESVLRDPVFLTVGTDNAGATGIDQRLMYVGREEGKLLAIRQLVQEGLHPPVLIFLQSKDRAKVSQDVWPSMGWVAPVLLPTKRDCCKVAPSSLYLFFLFVSCPTV